MEQDKKRAENTDSGTIINPVKSNSSVDPAVGKKLQTRHTKIRELCQYLSSPSNEFDCKKAYNLVENFIDEAGRWFYADISNYLFTNNAGTEFSNLESLQEYAWSIKETTASKKTRAAVDKLWDHANLVQKQVEHLRQDQEKYEKHFREFMPKVQQEMNTTLLSLIAIFTALSFMVFGGISSLDNIFIGAKEIPIAQLAIIGSIWGLCISNLVFVFMYFTSKMTKISLSATGSSGANFKQKYPHVFWSNYVLFAILLFSCWIFYIDYSNSGNWLMHFSRENEIISFGLGILAILFVLFVIHRISNRSPKK